MSDTYKEPKIIEFPGMTVRVYIPVLTQEEKNKRLNYIHKAAADLLKDTNK